MRRRKNKEKTFVQDYCYAKGCSAMRYGNTKLCQWHNSYANMGFSVEMEK